MAQDKIRTEEVDELLAELARLENPDEIYDLLMDLCTVREINEMSQRLRCAYLLANKVSYTEIQSRTGASSTTISRVSKCLNYGSGGYARAVEFRARQAGEE